MNQKKILDTLYQKTGEMKYTMKNDCLFKLVLQTDPKVLAALIASLLHMKREEILSVEVRNPIKQGDDVTAKTYILDILVRLNNNQEIDIEMQSVYSDEWRERSLGYLCRTFDNLNRGDDYINTKPAIHIGFLDFDLPGAKPEFYATYRMLNVKNHTEYSSKFTLSVVSLKRINMATEEDRKFEIDRWARLFAATTWEEIKMLAEQDKIMEKTAKLIVRYADEDEMNRMRIQAREDLINRERAEQRQKEQLKKDLADAKAALADKDVALADKDAALADKDAALADRDAALADKDAALADKDAAIANTRIMAVRDLLDFGISEEQILSRGYTSEEIAAAQKKK